MQGKAYHHYTRKITRTKHYLGINFQKYVMTFRVIDYTKNVWIRKIAEELHRTLSHINCTPASVACLGSWRAANPNRPVAQLGFPRRTWQTWGFVRSCGFPEHKKAGKYEYIGMYTRENGTFCPLAFFFTSFIVFFASKLDIIPLKCSVLGVYKGPWCGWKRTNGELGTTKNSRNAYKTREKPTIGLATGIGLKLAKNDF